MAKVTDIQDKNGVSKEIQDKDLANQTSVTSVGSTDYVMLEGADGAYHKIVKASFNEAVRAALGSVINSTAKGTDIAKLPVLDSNNDLGMGTLANVASVLGGVLTNIKGIRYKVFSVDSIAVGETLETDLYESSFLIVSGEGSGAHALINMSDKQVVSGQNYKVNQDGEIASFWVDSQTNKVLIKKNVSWASGIYIIEFNTKYL